MEEQQSSKITWKSFLTYVKENLAAISACLTVLISLSVALINLFDNINDRIIFEYWNISFDFISFSHKGFLYKIALSIISVIAFVLYYSAMRLFLTKYFFDGSGILFYNYAIRSFTISLKASRLRNRFSTIKLKRISKKAEKVNDEQIEEEIKSLKESIQDTDKNIEDISAALTVLNNRIKPKHVEKRYKFAFEIITAVVLLSIFFFFIISYLFPNNIINNLKISVVFALLFSFIHFAYYKTISVIYNNNNIKEITKDLDDEDFDRLTKSIFLKKPYGFSKKRIIRMTTICIFGLLFVLSFSLCKTYSNLQNQDTFYTTVINDEIYVYIYQNDDSFIFEKATIEGRSIHIDTSSQVLQEKTSISLKKQSFDKVIKE